MNWKHFFLLIILVFMEMKSFSWGFYGHQRINFFAVFLLPPEMMVLYKPNIDFLTEHAVDPDRRRYAVPEEGSRHYIDIDHYGSFPFDSLPRKWADAEKKYSKDSLLQYGIVPWHIQVMMKRLTNAFREKDFGKILKNSAEIGHYIADAHVPLHANSNHNGQFTNQKGIHGFWESRVPELLAEKEFDFFIGKAAYIRDPGEFIWARVLESAKASDSVLRFEKELTLTFSPDQKFSFEQRNSRILHQYSSEFTIAYNKRLNGMVERRMRQSVAAVASCWYTAWINAGQPDLNGIAKQGFSEKDLKDFEELNVRWLENNKKMIGRQED